MRKSTISGTAGRTQFVRLRRDVLLARTAGKSYREISHVYGITAPTARRIAFGVEPKSPHIRKRLKLPPLVSVAACVHCGEAHIRRRCPKRRRYRDLFDLPTAELARRLRERTDG